MTELFYAVLKASFQGSIVILAVMLLRLVLKKAPRRVFCLLWLLAGLRLALPFEIESNLSLQPRLDEQELSVQVEQPVQIPDVLIQNPEGQPLDEPSDPVQTPDLPENYENIQKDSFLYKVEDSVAEPLTWSDIAAPVWHLGMAAMVLASVWSYWKLKRRVREACLIENRCFECPGLETAFVLGFLPPRIYLPAGLSDREKQFIVDHENTHIARGDHWYKLLGYLVLSLHWFNPLVWLGYSLLCRDIELACDEHVVRNMSLPERKAYSAALLSCGGRTARFAACPVAFGESNPRRRIMNVLNYKRPTFWISLLAVSAVIFVAVCLLTSPETQEEVPQEEELLWNLEMKVADVSPFGLTVEFIQHGIFWGSDRANLQYGSEYTLERWVDGDWEAVEMLPQEYPVAWTMVAYLIELNSTKSFNIDWEWLYGELPAGRYRIGKNVDLFYRIDGETEHQMFYAEFTIEETEPEQPAWNLDMTDEEYLALCRNAVEEFQSRENYHISETIIYSTNGKEDTRNYAAYWRDGENWLRQSYVPRMKQNNDFLYYEGTLYLRKQEETGEPTWVRIDGGDGYDRTWLELLDWDAQAVDFVYAEQVEDVLHVFATVHSTPIITGWEDVTEYTVGFFFDQSGNLTNALLGCGRDNISMMSDLKFEDTAVANIRETLENVAAQRPDAPEQSLTENEWLETCRAALEEYQAHGIWAIGVENSFSGDAVLNDCSSHLWYIDGQNWLKQGVISNADFTQENWVLMMDGEVCTHDTCVLHNPANGDGFDTGWVEADAEAYADWPMPWPLEFDWDSESITFVEARTNDEGDMVRFCVTGSPVSAHGERVEEYLVTLWLFPDGGLRQIQLEYTCTELMGDRTRVQTTINPYAAASADVKNMLYGCHEEAMQHIHDNYGISCTVEGCTNPNHHHDDHHH